MSAHVLPASDRRYPLAQDADTIAHYFAAPLREKPEGRRDGAATYFDPPDWTDFDRSYAELSGGY